MVLEKYVNSKDLSLIRIIDHIGFSKHEVLTWDVLEYPDELLEQLSKQTHKKISVLLNELLFLENKVGIRRVAGDYSLMRAFESEAPVIFLDPEYRKSQTNFLTDVLVEKDIFDMELGPLTKFNVLGKTIYEGFLKTFGRTDEFKRLQDQIKDYFVFVHDDGGTLLCSASYLRRKEWQLDVAG